MNCRLHINFYIMHNVFKLNSKPTYQHLYFKCSPFLHNKSIEIFRLTITTSFIEFRCSFSLYTVKVAFALSNLFIIFEIITLDSGSSFSINDFKANSLFNTDHDVSLGVLFVPTCRIIFFGDFLISGFRKSYISSTVAPGNTRTLMLCFLFPLSRSSLIPYNIESPTINVVPFLHFFGLISIFSDLFSLQKLEY